MFIQTGHPADIFLIGTNLATFYAAVMKVVDCCHYIDLDLLWETQRNPNSEGPGQRLYVKTWTLVFRNPNYIPSVYNN